MEKLKTHIDFQNAQITTIDAVRVDYTDGWGLRPSNTTLCLVLRFQANNEQVLNKIKNKFRAWINDNDILY